MRKLSSFTIAAFAFLLMLGQTTSQDLLCDMACAVELYDETGDVRVETVIANCGANQFSEEGFSFITANQPTGCPCTVKAFCGYDQTGRYQTFEVPTDTSVNLRTAYKSAIIECNF